MYGACSSWVKVVVLMTLMSSDDSLPQREKAKNSLNAVVIICRTPALER